MLVGVVFAGLNYFKKPQTTASESHLVTSYNQSGGIIAHTINVPKLPVRHLNDRLRSDLDHKLAILSKDKANPITIRAVMNNREAIEFAEEIKGYLVKQGFQVDGVNKLLYEKPPSGIGIFRENDQNIIIWVGSND